MNDGNELGDRFGIVGAMVIRHGDSDLELDDDLAETGLIDIS